MIFPQGRGRGGPRVLDEVCVTLATDVSHNHKGMIEAVNVSRDIFSPLAVVLNSRRRPWRAAAIAPLSNISHGGRERIRVGLSDLNDRDRCPV